MINYSLCKGQNYYFKEGNVEAGSTNVYETRRQPADSIHQRENQSKPPTSNESGRSLAHNILE